LILPYKFLVANRYRIEELIGQGATTEVYRVFDVAQNQSRALKLIVTHLVPQEFSLPSILNEMEVSIRLKHPHIVPVYEIGNMREGIFITMSYIKGESLKVWINHKHHSIDEIQRVLLTLASHIGSALDYAHQNGIVHRDIKPSNIIIDEKKDMYLLDFGIASFQNGQGYLHPKLFLGTPPYRPPEDIQKSISLSSAVDVYSFASIIGEIVNKFLSGRQESYQLSLDTLANIQELIGKGTQPDPGKRYSSIADLCGEFMGILPHLNAKENLSNRNFETEKVMQP